MIVRFAGRSVSWKWTFSPWTKISGMTTNSLILVLRPPCKGLPKNRDGSKNSSPHFAAVIMYSLFGVVIIVFAWGLYERIGAYRRGRTERENRLDNLWDRTMDTLKIGFGQQKVLEKKIGGLMHLSIYSAFIVLFIATCLVAVEYDLGIRILDGNFYIVFKLLDNP